MSFNKSRRRIAGLLSILTAMGTTLAGRNFMVSAAVNENYFNGNDASELEKDVRGEDEKYLILKKDRRAPWQKNIADSDAMQPGDGDAQKCKKSDFLNVETNAGDEVFDGKKAGELFTNLKNAMKAQNMHDKYIAIVNVQAMNIKNQLRYNEQTGKAQLTADMSFSLTGDKVEDRVVYFHYGEKVYATTANILFQAQALTGEIIACAGENAGYTLAKECPLSAAMLVGVAAANADHEQNGIEEVTWMKYVYPGDKKLNGNYALKPSKPADHLNQAEYKFGNVKATKLLKQEKELGEEDLEGDLGKNGRNILIKKDNENYKYTYGNISDDNAYKSNFTVTRKINRTFSSFERAGRWVKNHKGELSCGFGGFFGGAVIAALLTSVFLKGDIGLGFDENQDIEEPEPEWE